MRVLVFHGYLLRGTGSNVYNASVAAALAALGCEVHLLCQDREAGRLDWIDAVGTWNGESFDVAPAAGSSPGSGSITAYRPEIGGLLPVYVADRYEGFEVKTFSELSDAELDNYIDSNVRAVRAVADALGGPEALGAALSNHLVMGPLILARAGLTYAAKVHGSALSYTVKPDHRFLPHAREGMDAASGVLVGSRHTAESLWETLEDPELPAKTRLGPPGVDIEAFASHADDDPQAIITGLAERLRAAATEVDPEQEQDSFARDTGAAAAALDRFAAADGARVIFVGKLIVSKGCDLLLTAWPLVAAANPGARLLMVGFGAYRDTLEDLWRAMAAGDRERIDAIAAAGWGLEGGEEKPLSILTAFLDSPPEGWTDACRAAAGSVAFAGRLEHSEVAELCPATDAMVVPSTFPEAFGMVAAEAAAAGALPVCADHSGLAEVAAALDERLPEPARGLTSFPLGIGSVEAIADRLDRWLALEPHEREAASASLAVTVADLWSWEGVARGIIAASAGELDGLPRVPSDPPPK